MKPGYLLFYSHAPQVEWLALLARVARRTWDMPSIMLVEGARDAAAATVTGAFEQVIDVASPRPPDPATDPHAPLISLAEIEDSVGESFVNESILMDRRLQAASASYEAAQSLLASVLGNVSHLLAHRGKPALLIVEPNVATKRLVHLLLRPTPGCYPYQITKFGDRIYFDYSLGYDWDRLRDVYGAFREQGIPDAWRQAAEATCAHHGQRYELPYDTRQLLEGRKTRSAAQSGARLLGGARDAVTGPIAFLSRARRYAAGWRGARYLRRHGASFDALRGVRYASYFMHVQPEHTVEGVAFPFRNQVDTAITIATALPAGMRLVVKEHPGMIGERGTPDYHRLRRCPNIVLTDPAIDQQQLLLGSRIIFTLSGTVAIEGLILGIPVVTLGQIYYNHFDGIFHFAGGLAQLKAFVRQVLSRADEVRLAAGANATRAIAAVLAASYPGRFSSMFTLDQMAAEDNLDRLATALGAELARVGAAGE